MKIRTMRGQFTEGDVHAIVVDDGRLNVGYKVRRFVVAGDPSGAANDAYAVLCLDYDAPSAWDWSDNRQIAWASAPVDSTGSIHQGVATISADHVVVRDLYVQGTVGSSGGGQPINYLIELEEVSLSDDEAVLMLIKERSQDDWR